MKHIDKNGYVCWRAATDCPTFIGWDGDVYHCRDGEGSVHRDGAPASIGPDGYMSWCKDDREIRSTDPEWRLIAPVRHGRLP